MMKEKRYIDENCDEKIQGNKKKSAGFEIFGLIIILTCLVPWLSPWWHIPSLVAIYCLISNRYYAITRIVFFVILIGQISISPGIDSYGIGKWIFYQQRRIAVYDKIFQQDTTRTPEYNTDLEKWGFVDKYGYNVISYKYDKVHAFSEELARVKLKDKYGFIDRAGKEVIPLIYDDAGSFHDGFAYVTSGDKSFFIDKRGKKKPRPIEKDIYFNYLLPLKSSQVVLLRSFSKQEGGKQRCFIPSQIGNKPCSAALLLPKLGTSHAALFHSFPNWEQATQTCFTPSQIGNEPRSSVLFIPKLGTSHAVLLQAIYKHEPMNKNFKYKIRT